MPFLPVGEGVSPPLSALFLLYVVVMPQKAAYTFHQFLFGIDSMEKLRSRQRIARKKAFVEHLSAAKGATGNIPGQMKEFTPACCGRVGGEIVRSREPEGCGSPPPPGAS